MIAKRLAGAGWIVAGDLYLYTYTVATKAYKTAVGIKEAVAFIQPLKEIVATLTGTYFSEGRNILSTTGLNIQPGMATDEIASGVDTFAAEVDATVAGSYAVKVLGASQEPYWPLKRQRSKSSHRAI